MPGPLDHRANERRAPIRASASPDSGTSRKETPLSKGAARVRLSPVHEEGDLGSLLPLEEEHGLVVADPATRDVEERDRRDDGHLRLGGVRAAVATRELQGGALEGVQLATGRVDLDPERVVGEAAREVANDDAVERGIAWAGADRAVEALRGGGGRAEPGVDRRASSSAPG